MRNTEIYVATKGRDGPHQVDGKQVAAKRFVITEMPALKAERWALRALLALTHAGAEIPDGAIAGGMAALAVAGFQSLKKLQFDEVLPLLDEMMECVRVMPDPKNPDFVRPLVRNGTEGDDIEEVATLWELRDRIFRIHTDFFLQGS